MSDATSGSGVRGRRWPILGAMGLAQLIGLAQLMGRPALRIEKR